MDLLNLFSAVAVFLNVPSVGPITPALLNFVSPTYVFSTILSQEGSAVSSGLSILLEAEAVNVLHALYRPTVDRATVSEESAHSVTIDPRLDVSLISVLSNDLVGNAHRVLDPRIAGLGDV